MRFKNVKKDTTPNFIRARERKLRRREECCQKEMEEANALGISVIGLRAQKAQEVERIIKESRVKQIKLAEEYGFRRRYWY